jgi:hypothetical protein
MLGLLSADDIAQLCSLSREQADRLIDSGELQFCEVVPGERRVFASSFLDYLDRQERASYARQLASSKYLTRALSAAIGNDQELRAQLLSTNPPAGSFGEMLRNAAAPHQDIANAENVISFPGSSAKR